jgi:hypothetical protein
MCKTGRTSSKWIRVGVLHQHDVAQVDGKADRMKVEPADGGRIALQPFVHLALRQMPDGLVEEEYAEHEQQCDNHSRAGHPPIPPGSAA